MVTSLSKCYSSLLDSMNAEIRIRWLQIVVRNDYYPDLHRVRRFLESQVRTPAHLSHPPVWLSDWASRGTGWEDLASGLAVGVHATGEEPRPRQSWQGRVWRGQAGSSLRSRPWACGHWGSWLRHGGA